MIYIYFKKNFQLIESNNSQSFLDFELKAT